MLRYNGSPSDKPRNYLLRREQVRLFSLVVLLGLVLLSIQQVKSQRVQEMLGLMFGEPTAEQPQNDQFEADGSVKEARQAAGPREQLQPSGLEQIDRSLFQGIKDNTYFRNEEQDAWFATLDHLKQTGGPAKSAPVTYTQLNSQPEAYRGRAVSISGVALRIEEITPAQNPLGIEKLYRIIVAPDGNEPWPITLYAINLPEGIDLSSEELRVPLQAEGYFFKNQSYRWQNGLGITPIVLTASIQPSPLPEADDLVVKQEADPTTILIAAGLVSLLLIGWFVVRTADSGRTTKPAEKPVGDFGALEEQDP